MQDAVIIWSLGFIVGFLVKKMNITINVNNKSE